MKRICTAVVAFGALQCVQASGISSGNDLVQFGFQVERRINDGLSQNTALDREIVGNFNGFVLGSVLMLSHTDPRVCLPKDATMQQHKAALRTYLDSNPSHLAKHATVVVREALLQAFPCKEK